MKPSQETCRYLAYWIFGMRKEDSFHELIFFSLLIGKYKGAIGKITPLVYLCETESLAFISVIFSQKR